MNNLNKKLVIAVSSRALFDLEEEHALFEEKGYRAYRDYQVSHKNHPLRPGVAFPFVKRLLNLNDRFGNLSPFQVVALSRNSPETAQRFFNSCRYFNLPITAGAFTSGQSTYPYINAFNVSLFLSANPESVKRSLEAGHCRYFNLPITAGAFTSGQSTYPYINAFNVSLFLSANPESVKRSLEAGHPAGLVLPSSIHEDDNDNCLRIAFDFDGVIADDESEITFQKSGIDAFHKLEQAKATTPHSPGPLSRLFSRLSEFQRLDYEFHGKNNPYFKPAIRISIVTSRGAPSEERLITTLKQFGMSAAELFLLDGLSKKPFLETIRPHIFFDDQTNHLEKSVDIVPSVLVPFGIHNNK